MTATSSSRRLLLASLSASVFALAAPSVVLAQTQPSGAPQPPQLQLNAEASTTVATDELTVRLAFEKEGTTVASLNTEVLRNLNDALTQAKRVPGVESRLSSLQTNPNWDTNGKRKGWRVRGEVVLRSKNVAGLSELAGKLGETLQMSGVDYGVSEDVQIKAREALIGDAANAFKAKAQASAKALGFTGYEVSNVSLSDGIHAPPPVAFKGRGAMMAMQADSVALPTDGGTQRLTVSFSGTVTLKP